MGTKPFYQDPTCKLAYLFDEASGNSQDSSAGNNPAIKTLLGAGTITQGVAGPFGSKLTVTSANADTYLITTNPVSLGSNIVTVVGWMAFGTLGNPVFFTAPGSNGAMFSAGISGDWFVGFTFNFGSGKSNYNATYTIPRNGAIAHYAIVVDNNTGTIKFYYNGVLTTPTSSTISKSGSDIYQTVNWKLACTASTYSSAVSSSIDDFAIFSRELSASEIAQIYSQGLASWGYTPAIPNINSPTGQTSIQLRDPNGKLVKILNKVVKSLTWDYDRIGGCGRATLALVAPYDWLETIGPDYDIQVWFEDSSGTSKLWYRGYLESYNPILQDQDNVNLSLFGYVGQLKRVRVARTYTATELSVIVRDILDTLILPNTDIVYDAADIVPTGFSVDSLTFDAMGDSALKTLADLAGGYEWGVNVNKKFFFKPYETAIRHYLRIGKDVANYDPIDDYSQIVNRIYLKGGNSFTDQIDNTESQSAYGLRSQVISNSAITTSSVAQKYGTGLLSEQAKVQRRISLNVAKNLKLYEATVPLGSLALILSPIPQAKKYADADAIYGTFKYGGMPSFQIDKLTYKLGSEGTELTIQGGSARPNIYLQLKRLQYEIDQLRGGG